MAAATMASSRQKKIRVTRDAVPKQKVPGSLAFKSGDVVTFVEVTTNPTWTRVLLADGTTMGLIPSFKLEEVEEEVLPDASDSEEEGAPRKVEPEAVEKAILALFDANENDEISLEEIHEEMFDEAPDEEVAMETTMEKIEKVIRELSKKPGAKMLFVEDGATNAVQAVSA